MALIEEDADVFGDMQELSGLPPDAPGGDIKDKIMVGGGTIIKIWNAII